MLSNAEKYILFTFMQALLNTGSLDSRVLITRALQALSSQMPLNRHHAAGMLAALKKSGRTFTVIQSGYATIVS